VKKVLDFLFGGRKIYIIINVLFAAALAVYVIFDVTFTDFWLFISDASMTLTDILSYYSLLTLPFLIAVNTAAFFEVKKGSKWGIVFSLLFGFVGSFIAVHSVRKDYFGARAINIIFSIYYWVFGIIPAFPYFMGYYTALFCIFAIFFALMFLMLAGVSRVVPTDKLMIANLLVNAGLSAVGEIVLNPDHFGVLYALHDLSLYVGMRDYVIMAALVLVVFLISYAPNYILYKKHRTEKPEHYSFKTHLKKTAAVWFCNLSTMYAICFIIFSGDIIWFVSYD